MKKGGPGLSPLRVRLMLLVLLAVVPSWGLMVYSAWEQRREAVTDIRDQVRRMADLVTEQERRYIETVRRALSGVARYIRASGNDPDACRRYLEGLSGHLPPHLVFGVAGADGRIICRTGPGGGTLREAVWLRRITETKGFVVIETRTDTASGSPAFVAAHPLISEGGGGIGAVFSVARPERIIRLEDFLRQRFSTQAALTLVNSEGMVLARRFREEGPSPGHLLPEGFLDQLSRTEEGVLDYRDPTGTRFLVSHRTLRSALAGRPHHLILSVPAADLYGPADRTLRRNLLGLGAVAGLALLIAWLGADGFVLRRVRALIQATHRLRSGDLKARVGKPYGPGELGTLSEAFDEMAETLDRNARERTDIEAALRRSRRALRNLSHRLQEAREEEKARIAREIHDVLGQQMTALKIDVSWLKARLDPEDEALRRRAESMTALIDEAVGDVQRISMELRPGILDDLGLQAAVEWQAETFARRTEIPCEVRFYPEEIDLDRSVATALFRIIQEAMTNIIRHAEATRVSVELRRTDGDVVLTVADDGKGIPPEKLDDPAATGIIGIRERAAVIHGRAEIGPAETGGTTVTVAVPMEKASMREKAGS